jgi:hypothetical protein
VVVLQQLLRASTVVIGSIAFATAQLTSSAARTVPFLAAKAYTWHCVYAVHSVQQVSVQSADYNTAITLNEAAV